MDATVMHKWVDVVLQPYVAEAPEGIVPILMLDSYRAHMMEEIVTKIQNLGVEVVHIPGGCTGNCQPVDIGLNKSFKSHVRRIWDAWMIQKWDQVTAQDNTPKPKREEVSSWVIDAFKAISPTAVKNAWRKEGFEWFDKASTL